MANTTWSTTDLVAATLTGSNLIATATGVVAGGVRAADRQLTGKWYWETVVNSWPSQVAGVGIMRFQAAFASFGANAGTDGAYVAKTGTIFINGADSGQTLGIRASGDLICHALDCDNKLYWMRVGAAGNWNGSATANPATGVGGLDIGVLFVTGEAIYPAAALGTGADKVTANFGDSAFTGTAPSGFTSGFTAGTSVTSAVVVSQVAREVLYSKTASIRLSQVVRETLRSQAGTAWSTSSSSAQPQVCVVT